MMMICETRRSSQVRAMMIPNSLQPSYWCICKICLPSAVYSSFYIILLKAGMRVCASQKEKVSLGPVMRSLGIRPLKKADGPS